MYRGAIRSVKEMLEYMDEKGYRLFVNNQMGYAFINPKLPSSEPSNITVYITAANAAIREGLVIEQKQGTSYLTMYVPKYGPKETNG